MEKVYKHKKTGQIAYYKDGVFRQNNCLVEIGVEPSSEFWTELTYEILSFRSHRNRFYNPTIQKDGTYLDAEIMEFDGNGASLEWMLNEDEYYITSVKRLSDGEIFKVGDKAQTIGSYPHTITSIEVRQKSLRKEGEEWLKDGIDRIWFDWELGCGGNWLDTTEKVKEPILTTEDGVNIFQGDSYYYVNKNNFYIDFVVSADKKFDSKKEDMLDFKHKENAEEFILMNKPLLSLNDLLSVWCNNDEFDAYKNSPMFQNFKNLAKTKL